MNHFSPHSCCFPYVTFLTDYLIKTMDHHWEDQTISRQNKYIPHKCSIVLHFKAFPLLLIRACLHESRGTPGSWDTHLGGEPTCPSNLLFNLDHVFMIGGVTCQGQLLGLPAIHHVITSRLVNLPSWGLVHVKLFTSPPKTPSWGFRILGLKVCM